RRVLGKHPTLWLDPTPPVTQAACDAPPSRQ
ncbi:hypothetical protein TIFTF001_018902, partial [Ficus carica]